MPTSWQHRPRGGKLMLHNVAAIHLATRQHGIRAIRLSARHLCQHHTRRIADHSKERDVGHCLEWCTRPAARVRALRASAVCPDRCLCLPAIYRFPTYQHVTLYRHSTGIGGSKPHRRVEYSTPGNRCSTGTGGSVRESKRVARTTSDQLNITNRVHRPGSEYRA